MTQSKSVPTFALFTAFLALGAMITFSQICQADSLADAAKEILADTGTAGGLVVHVGCGDGKLTAALGTGDGFLVQGLDADEANVQAARRVVRSKGLYGRVTIDRLSGRRLPYIDNLVNLLVIDDPAAIDGEEITRVLAPGGVALTKKGGGWTKSVKPRGDEIDDWTHYLHDASNNAVAADSVVGPPRHMQWVGGPRYSRHHDRMSSVSAVVSAGGRVFYIIDEAPPISALAPAKWKLVARDAFSGVVLWKRSIDQWHTHLWPLKSGPAQLPRRLVAAGNRVYVTLSLDGPLLALDAATGRTVHTYWGTKATEEVILADGTLFALVNDAAEKPDYDGTGRFNGGYGSTFYDEKPRKIEALSADSGELLWSSEQKVLPGTMAADDSRLVFHNGESVVCLDRNSGDESWRSAPIDRSEKILGYFVPILVLYEDVVLFSGGETAGSQTGSWYESGKDTLTALDAGSGRELWTAYHPPSGYRSPEDVLVVDGLVWTGETTSGRAAGVFIGRDPKTGEVKRRFPPDVDTYWFHHRCYRGKATEKYLLMSRTGIEFVDLDNEKWITNHWVRGACLYGIMPANGLIYAPQHPCACYLEAKQYGFNALAPARGDEEKGRGGEGESEAGRLDRGPAYEPAAYSLKPTASPDWPTYRQNTARSGYTKESVPADLGRAWQTELGGRLSAPVVSGGAVFVASVDNHTVHALDAESGTQLWRFSAAGRVDSPPTIYRGLVLFGSADGSVYALRASDGVLAWRRRASPVDRRLVSFEQVESVWPIHGSVLVHDDVLWCVAGRSMFLDGGLRLLRIDPATGQLLSETVMDGSDPASSGDLQEYVSWLNMPPALPDVLSTDGRLVYMRSQPFELDGTRLPLEAMPTGPDADRGAPPATQNPEHAHLFSPTGFLDDTWWHRTYWLYGSRFISGWCGYFRAGKAAPAGRILVYDDSRIYGFGRKPQFYKWTVPIEHHLFAADKLPAGTPEPDYENPFKVPFLVTHHWSTDVPLFARAMLLADRTLFIAGPADVIDEEQAYREIKRPEVARAVAQQAAVLEGSQGALLWAVSTDGTKLAEQKLDSPPVFDGMAAAGGRLYISTTAEAVLCLDGQ